MLARVARLNSIEIYADTIRTNTSQLVIGALPAAERIIVNANLFLSLNPGRFIPFPKYNFFELLGFPDVLLGPKRSPGNHVLPQKDLREMYKFTVERLEGLKFIQGLWMPTASRVIQSVYRGPPFTFDRTFNCNGPSCRVTLSALLFYATFPDCASWTDASTLINNFFLSGPLYVPYPLPLMCIRKIDPFYDQEFSLYFFDWDLYTPDLPSYAGPMPNQYAPAVGGKLEPSLWYYAHGRQIVYEKNEADVMQFGQRNREVNLPFFERVTTWYLPQPWVRVLNWTVDEGTQFPDAKLPLVPYIPPDIGLATILLNCWSTAFRLPPYQTFFVASIDDLIRQLSRPGGRDGNDAALTGAVKLRTDQNLTFAPGQRPVTLISYQLYLDTLKNYASAYQGIQSQLDNSLSFLETGRQRREYALALLETSRNSASSSSVVVFRLEDQLKDVTTAWEAVGVSFRSSGAEEDSACKHKGIFRTHA